MTMSNKQFAVSDARKLCRSLVDAVNDVVLIFEPESSRVLAANKSACQVYGYTKKEMVGKHLQMLTHDTTNYLHVLRSGRTFERTDITKEGARIDFLVSLSSIDYWGRRAILSINRDISDRKRIEAAIQQMRSGCSCFFMGFQKLWRCLMIKGSFALSARRCSVCSGHQQLTLPARVYLILFIPMIVSVHQQSSPRP